MIKYDNDGKSVKLEIAGKIYDMIFESAWMLALIYKQMKEKNPECAMLYREFFETSSDKIFAFYGDGMSKEEIEREEAEKAEKAERVRVFLQELMNWRML